ncbi:uncharacterized protein LOC131939478 [Physella acuta]|uniref:uncharacterized protein LOC131939478 n=1 Tax=Physella acuta TaxID=109671 RepID=UPI0027DBE704|nr:uncharacterized protein LOC131939478 [Physella acuta]
MASLVMRNTVLVLVLVVLLGAPSSAYWKKWYNSESPKYWSLRSGACSGSGQPCSRDKRCCHHHDTCLTSRQEVYDSLVVTTFCRDVRLDQEYGAPLKEDGQPCSDSIQCQNMCCREYRGAGFGVRAVCGTQSDSIMNSYTCITSAR